MTESPDDQMVIYRRLQQGSRWPIRAAILAKDLTHAVLAASGMDINQQVVHMSRAALDVHYPNMTRVK